jgi:hypothetical protein
MRITLNSKMMRRKDRSIIICPCHIHIHIHIHVAVHVAVHVLCRMSCGMLRGCCTLQGLARTAADLDQDLGELPICTATTHVTASNHNRTRDSTAIAA